MIRISENVSKVTVLALTRILNALVGLASKVITALVNVPKIFLQTHLPFQRFSYSSVVTVEN